MPDGTKSLPERLAADLAVVHWPEPDEIRARARRRTYRGLVVVPAAVLLVVAAVWAGAGAGREDHDSHVATPPTSEAPAPTASGPTVLPTFVVPGNPAWIPPEALLQPADLGTGYEITNDHSWEPGQYPTWTFNFDGMCPAYAPLDVTAYQRYLFMRINTVGKNVQQDGGQAVHEEVMRFPGDTAKQVVADARRVVAACPQFTTDSEASTEQHPAYAVHRWVLVDNDFAGDESLLLRQGVTHVERATDQELGDPSLDLYAVVRVGDLVAVVQTDDYDEGRVRQLARRAAAWLCTAATHRC